MMRKLYKKISLISLFSFFLLLTVACDKPLYNNIDNVQLQGMLDKNTPIYDIRRPEEWRQTGVVSGSKKLTFVDGNGRLLPDFFKRFTAEIDKNEPVVLICRTGNRTRALAKHLTENMGYTQVYNVRNGITEWIRDGKEVKRL